MATVHAECSNNGLDRPIWAIKKCINSRLGREEEGQRGGCHEPIHTLTHSFSLSLFFASASVQNAAERVGFAMLMRHNRSNKNSA